MIWLLFFSYGGRAERGQCSLEVLGLLALFYCGWCESRGLGDGSFISKLEETPLPLSLTNGGGADLSNTGRREPWLGAGGDD